LDINATQARVTVAQLALNGMSLSKVDRNPRAFREWYDAIADKVIAEEPEYEVELEPTPPEPTLEVIECGNSKSRKE